MLRHGLRRALQQRVRAAHVLPSGGRALGRGLSTDSEEEESAEVCFIDPALVLEPERLQEYKTTAHESSIQPYVCVSIPAKLAQALKSGHFQLGDADDPQSHWFFGRQGEIFQYKYAGSHVVQSGFSSAVPAEEVYSLERGELPRGPPERWAHFAAGLEAGRPLPPPFLFAGRVVDCESAGVYWLAAGGGDPEGLMLSSEYETAGAE